MLFIRHSERKFICNKWIANSANYWQRNIFDCSETRILNFNKKFCLIYYAVIDY